MTSYPAPPEPRIGPALGHGWHAMRAHFWILLAMAATVIGAAVLISIPASIAAGFGPDSPAFQIPLNLASQIVIVLVTVPLAAGYYLGSVQASRGEHPAYATVFSGYRRFVDLALAYLIVAVLTLVGFLLLIVPGLYVAARLFPTIYLIMDQGLSWKDALATSWRIMKPSAWRYVLLSLLAIPLAVLGILALGVGLLVVMVWLACTSAGWYRAVSGDLQE